jgi:type IV secretory pathway VirB9-like protein
MKTLILSLMIAIGLYATALASSRVKKVEVQKDQIVRVNTALGIATIIQVPDRPNSVVVGDQDAFKVEYLDLAITIKPITAHGKSNLYIYTDYRRFNVELATGSESAADYVVYLENPANKERGKNTKSEGRNISWKKFNRSFRNESVLLELNRIGTTRSGVVIAEFTLSSSKMESVNPAWFWIPKEG